MNPDIIRTIVASMVAATAASAQIGTPATERLTPASTERLDLAGYQLAATGDWLFVALPQDNVTGFNSGSVTPFRFDDVTGAWVEEDTVISIGAYGGQFWGTAIAASGDTLVVGSPQDTRLALAGGFVEVFERVGDSWRYTQDLFTITPIERGDLFGSSVAIRGDLLVVGSPSAQSRGPYSGRVSVFERFGDRFEPVAEFERGDEDDLYGWSVAVGDGFFAAGTFNIDGDTYTYRGRGSVDVYEKVGDDWQLTATLEQDVPGFNERFGWSMDAASDVLVVGAYNEGSVPSLFTGPGAVYVFEKVDGVWTRTARLEPPDLKWDQQFGFDVNLSEDGTGLLVGAQNDPEVAEDAGAIYAYERDGRSWRFVQKFVSPASTAIARSEQFGTSVAYAKPGADRSWLVGGAPESDELGFRAGNVYAAELSGCPVDCDASGGLDIFDFLCFQKLFAAGDPAADFDDDGDLTIFDFLAFQTAFEDGCA
ncbi:MAG: FG-GAP repeat protein [Phycisphaerales bacterium]